jgi:hypothetical protein
LGSGRAADVSSVVVLRFRFVVVPPGPLPGRVLPALVGPARRLAGAVVPCRVARVPFGLRDCRLALICPGERPRFRVVPPRPGLRSWVPSWAGFPRSGRPLPPFGGCGRPLPRASRPFWAPGVFLSLRLLSAGFPRALAAGSAPLFLVALCLGPGGAWASPRLSRPVVAAALRVLSASPVWACLRAAPRMGERSLSIV